MKTYTEVPNLDAMNLDELADFKSFIGKNIKDACVALFGRSDAESIHVATCLWMYANIKELAMHDRIGGYIQTAVDLEYVCENLYSDLPEFAKW